MKKIQIWIDFYYLSYECKNSPIQNMLNIFEVHELLLTRISGIVSCYDNNVVLEVAISELKSEKMPKYLVLILPKVKINLPKFRFIKSLRHTAISVQLIFFLDHVSLLAELAQKFKFFKIAV